MTLAYLGQTARTHYCIRCVCAFLVCFALNYLGDGFGVYHQAVTLMLDRMREEV
jgi:hypothetical protein